MMSEEIVHPIQFKPLLYKVISQAEDFGYRNEPLEITPEMIELNNKLIQLENCKEFLKD